jgi:hypothetical protein
MKKRAGHIRREWGEWVEDEGAPNGARWVVSDVTYQPIDPDHPAIPNAWWHADNGNHVWMKREPDAEARAEWYAAQDVLDEAASTRQHSDAGRSNRGTQRWHTTALEALLSYAGCQGVKPKPAFERFIALIDDTTEEEKLADVLDRAAGAPVYLEDICYEGYTPKKRGKPLFHLVRQQGRTVDRATITVGIFQDAVTRLKKA